MSIKKKTCILLFCVLAKTTTMYAQNNNERLVLDECAKPEKYLLEDFESSDSCAKEFPLELSLNFDAEKYTFSSYEEKIEAAKRIIFSYFQKISQQLPPSSHTFEHSGKPITIFSSAAPTMTHGTKEIYIKLGYSNCLYTPKIKSENEKRWIISKEQRDEIKRSIAYILTELGFREFRVQFHKTLEGIYVTFSH